MGKDVTFHCDVDELRTRHLGEYFLDQAQTRDLHGHMYMYMYRTLEEPQKKTQIDFNAILSPGSIFDIVEIVPILLVFQNQLSQLSNGAALKGHSDLALWNWCWCYGHYCQ